MNEIGIITHRGLDPDRKGSFKESTKEAFTDEIQRGFGLEFDVRLTKDRGLIVMHDKDLSRMTNGLDRRAVSEVPLKELLSMDLNGCHFISLQEMLALIDGASHSRSIHALHVKAALQEKQTLALLSDALAKANPDRYVLFDLNIESARFLKAKNPRLHLAPSVAHPYDILRYGDAVGKTLLPLETVIEECSLFDWVWLDEWDRRDRNGTRKSLYNATTFERLRRVNLSIALVTPELHRTSPELLGGEAHEDAATKERLFERFKEIIALSPDAVCTDYPDAMRSLMPRV